MPIRANQLPLLSHCLEDQIHILVAQIVGVEAQVGSRLENAIQAIVTQGNAISILRVKQGVVGVRLLGDFVVGVDESVHSNVNGGNVGICVAFDDFPFLPLVGQVGIVGHILQAEGFEQSLRYAIVKAEIAHISGDAVVTGRGPYRSKPFLLIAISAILNCDLNPHFLCKRFHHQVLEIQGATFAYVVCADRGSQLCSGLWRWGDDYRDLLLDNDGLLDNFLHHLRCAGNYALGRNQHQCYGHRNQSNLAFHGNPPPFVMRNCCTRQQKLVPYMGPVYQVPVSKAVSFRILKMGQFGVGFLQLPLGL